ncbi:MAG: hypothetical protein R6U32_01900 [Candidatus Woesearchaeota archaeon]
MDKSGKEYLLMLLPAGFLLVFLLVMSGCSQEAADGADEDADENMGASRDAMPEDGAGEGDTGDDGKIGNVPKESLDSLSSIKCGDGICHNREYLSDSKRFECRSLLDSCSIDADGRKIGTENYYICSKDCSAECSLDVSIDVCEKSDDVYEITVDDRKGNLYNYLILYKGENFPFMKYGGGEGSYTLDLSSVAQAVGGMESISIMPRIMNDDGTIAGCSNHEEVFESVESC